MVSLAIPLFALALLAADKRDAEKFQGVWLVSGAEYDGMPNETLKGDSLTIDGESFTIKAKEGEMKGKLQFVLEKSFTAVDFIHTDGPAKSKTLLAIAEVKGDDCKICFAPPDAKERPTEMAAKAGSKYILVKLKREKK